MSKNLALEKRAKEVIMSRMEGLKEITTEAVMALVRPHFQFDASKAREQALRRKAHSLMAQFKDETGVRTCFNYSDNGESKYVNIDETKSLKALNGVDIQISKKYYGLNEAKKKINRRRIELSGQMELFDHGN